MNQPTSDFHPIDEPLHLTKELAAARQVQAAIQALQYGSYDVAITLAGAAEEMLPGDPEVEITSQLFQHPSSKDVPAPYKWREIVNLERNWLKHRTDVDKMPEELTLDLENTPFYIYRAMRKLPLSFISAEMLAFETWYVARVARQVEQRNARG